MPLKVSTSMAIDSFLDCFKHF